MGLLRLAVFVLAVIHQLGDRRLGRRRNLDKIDLGLLRHLQGLRDGHDADLLAVYPDQTHLDGVDLGVDALSVRCDVRFSGD